MSSKKSNSITQKRKCSEHLFGEQLISECSNLTNGEYASNLTFLQYQSMSNEERTRLSNRVRQWALKARDGLPKEHSLFCLVVGHLLKNAHRYFKLHSPTELQKHIMHDKSISDANSDVDLDESKNANKKLRMINELKGKNRIHEQQELVNEMKENYQTFRNIVSVSGVSLKTVHSWCSIPKQKVHKGKELSKLRRAEFIDFLSQDTISFEHPCKKFSGKRFLRDTLEITRKKYLEQRQYHKYGIISMSSMKKYRPSNILLCGSTPLDQCLCDTCENFEQLVKTLIALGMKQIPGNRYAAVEKVLCVERYTQAGSDYTYPGFDCIYGNCTRCGEMSLEELIRESNQQMITENKHITWRKWLNQEGTKPKAKCQIKGTIRQAITELITLLRGLKPHLFRANWNRNTFEYIKRNLQPGHIVQIFDFAMNFRNWYQDEIQSAYYGGSQTSIHAVINYFNCPNEGCSELVTLILAQITDDLGHDSFVARAGHDASFRYLAQLGLAMDCIIQFSDNCSSQYKS